MPGLHNVGQNSQNITFGDYPGGALGLDADATYTYELFAVMSGDGVNGTRLADVFINVVIGAGGAAVPESGATFGMLALGLVGLVGFGARRRSLKV